MSLNRSPEDVKSRKKQAVLLGAKKHIKSKNSFQNFNFNWSSHQVLVTKCFSCNQTHDLSATNPVFSSFATLPDPQMINYQKLQQNNLFNLQLANSRKKILFLMRNNNLILNFLKLQSRQVTNLQLLLLITKRKVCLEMMMI